SHGGAPARGGERPVHALPAGHVCRPAPSGSTVRRAMGAGPAGRGAGRAAFGGTAVSRFPAVGAGAFQTWLHGRRGPHDGLVDGPACRLFDGGDLRGVPDRPLLLVAAVADGQSAGPNLLSRSL